MGTQRDDYILGFKSDPSGLRQYLRELQVIPAALDRVSKEVRKIDLGGQTLSAQQGKRAAQALIRAYRAELSGGDFTRALGRALSGANLGLPPATLTRLSNQLARVRREIQETVSLQSSLGLPRGTNLSRAFIPPTPASTRTTPRATAESQPPQRATIPPTPTSERAVRAAAKTAAEAEKNAKLAEQEALLERKKALSRQRAIRALQLEETVLQGGMTVGQARERTAQRRTLTAARNEASGVLPVVDEGSQRRLLQRAKEEAKGIAALNEKSAERQREIRSKEEKDRTTRTLQEDASRQRRLRAERIESGREDRRRVEAERLRVQQDRLATLRQQGPLGQFRAGLSSRAGTGQIEEFARTFAGSVRFTAGFQAFQLMQQSLVELVSGSLQFDEALAKLSVTFDESKDDLGKFATEVGALANNLGVTAAVGVEAAARAPGIFGFAGQEGLSEQERNQLTKNAVEVSSRVAFVSGRTDQIVETQQNLAGVLRSFKLLNNELSVVEDSTASVSKDFGVMSGELLDATAQIGEAAQARGFSLQQLQGILATQSQRTALPSGTISGTLGQIFASADKPEVLSRLREAGIQTEGTTTAQQLEQLAALRKQGAVTEETVNQIAAAFGRGGRSFAAFLGLLEDFDRVNQAATRAQDRPGIGQDIFEKQTNSVSFQLRKLVGDFRTMATQLAQSGIFDSLGIFLRLIQGTVAVLNEFLMLFNELPRGFRTTIFALIELRLAMIGIAKLGGATAVINATSNGLKKLFSVLALSNTRQAITGVTSLTAAQSAAGFASSQTVTSRVRSGLGAARATGSSALAAVGGPAGVAVIAGAVLATGIYATIKARADLESQKDIAGETSRTARTSEELRGAASELRALSGKAREQQGFGIDARTIGTFGLAPALANRGGSFESETIRDSERRAAQLEARADAIDKRKQTAGSTGIFGRFESIEEVNTALDDLNSQGFSAAEQVNLVSRAIDNLAAVSSGAAEVIIDAGRQEEFNQIFGTAATSAINDAIEQVTSDITSIAPYKAPGLNPFEEFVGKTGQMIVDPLQRQKVAFGATDKLEKQREALKNLDPGKIQADFAKVSEDFLKDVNKTGEGQQALSGEELQTLKDRQLQKFQQENGGVLSGLSDEYRKSAVASFKAFIDQQLSGDFGKDRDVSPQQVNAAVQAAIQTTEKLGQQLREENNISGLEEQRNKLSSELGKVGALAFNISDPQSRQQALKYLELGSIEVRNIEREIAQAQLDYANDLRSLTSVRGRSQDTEGQALAQIQNIQAQIDAETDPAKITKLQIQLEQQLNQQRIQALSTKANIEKSRIDPRDSIALASAELADAQRRLAFAQAEGDADAQAQAAIQVNQAIVSQRQANLALRQAKRTAFIPIGDEVAAARVALAGALDERNTALKGTTEYYNALRQISEARQQIANAILERQKNIDMLSIDATDPVAVALQEVKAARRALASARGEDAQLQARISLRDAQNQAEGAAFQQRLSDVQTADELGRISHEAYLSYLQSEHNRLSAIAKRTRQQQDQLDQIDQLMKTAADELSGQFNIGNIKLPTIYEVRRVIRAGSIGTIGEYNRPSAASPTINDHSVRQVNIHGVPIQEVLRYVEQVLGASVSQRISV